MPMAVILPMSASITSDGLLSPRALASPKGLQNNLLLGTPSPLQACTPATPQNPPRRTIRGSSGTCRLGHFQTQNPENQAQKFPEL